MNCAQAELNRVLSVVAERHHGATCDFTMDNLFYYKSHDGYQGYLNYYFYDKHGCNEFGDTSLHRILAVHVPGHVVEDFVRHMNRHRVLLDATGSSQYQQPRPPHAILNVDPPRLIDQNHAGATALHVAVCRNSWHAEDVVRILLRSFDEEHNRQVERGELRPDEAQSLASIPMSCGTYPLHIACGMHTTIRRDLLTTLLKADPSVAIRDDVNGDNAFSLLWKNVLRFNWARIMERGDTSIEFIDHCAESLPTWQTIIGRDEYWKYSMLMLRAAINKEDHDSLVDIEQQIKLHHIAAISRCPSLLIRMALASAKFRAQLLVRDDDGMCPLHHAAAATAYTTKYLPFPRSLNLKASRPTCTVGSAGIENTPPTPLSTPPIIATAKAANSVCLRLQTVLSILSEAYPDAAAIRDSNGRLPLHHALLSGKGWNAGVEVLFDIFPGGIEVPDPETGLFPFMLAAAMLREHRERASRKTGRRKSCGGQRPEILGRRLLREEHDALTTSFLLLKQCPEVIVHCI